MTDALEIRDVSVTFRVGSRRVAALRNVSLSVPQGAIVGVVGESGSGKSTLARVAVGLQRPDGGDVRFNGRTARELRAEHSRAGRRWTQMVFQDPSGSLNPRMTVEETLAEALRESVARSERSGSVATLLDRVGLPASSARKLPRELSGGMRQRVSIARALAPSPKVLIADEITSALDVSVQARILNLIRQLHDELDLSILFISHNIAVVRYVCDEIAVMRGGVIVEQGQAEAVIDHPQNEYSKALMAAVPRLAMSAQERRALVAEA